jgi:hypothetical protein
MLPADEGLGAERVTAVKGVKRLEEDAQFATLDGETDLGLGALERELLVALGAADQLVAARALGDGAGERVLGLVEHGRGLRALVLGHDDADAHLCGDRHATDEEGRVEAADETLGEGRALLLVREAFGDDGEVVALEAGDGVATADDLDESSGRGLQKFVSALLAETGAVELHGEREHGDVGLGPHGGGQGVTEAVDAEGAVGKTRERVVKRFVAGLVLGEPAGLLLGEALAGLDVGGLASELFGVVLLGGRDRVVEGRPQRTRNVLERLLGRVVRLAEGA